MYRGDESLCKLLSANKVPFGELQSVFVILFFVLFIGQLSMQLVGDNIYLDFLKICLFLDVCFSSKFANIIASVRTGLNQLH